MMRVGARRSLAIVFAILAATLVVSVVRGDLASAARTWHVSTGGSDSADGTSNRPLRTIEEAVGRASSGDTVEVRGGTYRESVQVYGKAVHIRSRAGQRAIIDGSVRVDGWRNDGGAWVVDGWTHQFQSDFGSMVPDDNQTAGLPDQVFIDGQQQIQVTSRSALTPGTFFHETDADRIWLADNPTGKQVDVSNRSWGVYFNNADGSKLTNVTVRRFGTERQHMAAIRAYSNNIVLDGVIVEQNAAIGISVIGRDVTVRNGRASDNGYIGVHADRATNLVVDAMSIIANNRAGFDSLHSASGLKVTSSTGITVSNSHVAFNDGPGIWTDIDTSSVDVVNNLTESNRRSGIEIELSSNVVVAGNTALDNLEAGIWILESTQAQVWNNAAYNNKWQIKVEEGPRHDVQDVTIRNNAIGATGAGIELLHVNDWTGDRSGAQMGVTENNSLFWQPVGSSRTLSKWARWPSPHANSSTLQAHRQGTGQGSNSRVVGGALPAINSGCGDYRVPDGYLGGEPLPNSIADLLGVSAGTVRAVGPTAPGPYMMYGWPLSKPTDEPLVEKAELNSAVGGLSAAISSPGLVQATRLAPPAPGPGTGVPSNC